MKIIGIIPARLDSTRLPRKALININNKTLIQRVYENTRKANILENIFVATNDLEIQKNIKSFGGQFIVTKKSHLNGTERCNEAINNLKMHVFENDVIVNIQCDEPMIEKGVLESIYNTFIQNPKLEIVSVASTYINNNEMSDQSVVKVHLNSAHFATKFCRIAKKNSGMLKHIGIYAYRKETLQKLANLKPTSLEKAEKLEQLRWLENKYHIKCIVTPKKYFSINTKQDLNNYKENYIL